MNTSLKIVNVLLEDDEDVDPKDYAGRTEPVPGHASSKPTSPGYYVYFPADRYGGAFFEGGWPTFKEAETFYDTERFTDEEEGSSVAQIVYVKNGQMRQVHQAVSPDDDDVDPKDLLDGDEPIPDYAENKPDADGYYIYFPQPVTHDDESPYAYHTSFEGGWPTFDEAALFLDSEVGEPTAHIVYVENGRMRRVSEPVDRAAENRSLGHGDGTVAESEDDGDPKEIAMNVPPHLPPFADYRSIMDEVRGWPEWSGDVQKALIEFWMAYPSGNGLVATLAVYLAFPDDGLPELSFSMGYENVEEGDWHELEDLEGTPEYNQARNFLDHELANFLKKLEKVARFKRIGRWGP